MLRENVCVEDLKNEILSLKKRFTNVQSENHLLKVKVRKLQDELSKKDKHIKVLLDPKKVIIQTKYLSKQFVNQLLMLYNF